MTRWFALAWLVACLGGCTFYDRVVVVGDGARDGDASFDVMCPPGQLACDGQCIVPDQNPRHCGRCGNACSNAGGMGVCAAGVCRILCDESHLDCDRNADNGCEVDPTSNFGNCGGCGRACMGDASSMQCRGGACVRACPTGFDDCDRVPENGCETNIAGDAMNCGACGRGCANPHGTTTCSSGRCSPSCDTGFADCDGHPENGCEANLASDGQNCGGCGAACLGMQVCSGRVCASTCATGVNCSGTCADTMTDPSHCGSCTTACPSGVNSVPTCTAAACGIRCNAGFGDCNGNPFDGCETPLQFDAMHCGSCTTSCPQPAMSTPACTGGMCSFTCTTGFANCDATASNGCETSLRTSTANCGMCGHACTAGQTCIDGNCACPSGTSPCGNGCVDFSSDPGNCGSCGRACPGGSVCAGGVCSMVCASPRQMCGAACVDPTTDVNNCGACGHVCPMGGSCSSGTCQCPAGQSPCDGFCRDLTSDPSNCGFCGATCGADQTCNFGNCECPAGGMPCFFFGVNRCVNTDSDSFHCGACDNMCGIGSVCLNGVCQ